MEKNINDKERGRDYNMQSPDDIPPLGCIGCFAMLAIAAFYALWTSFDK